MPLRENRPEATSPQPQDPAPRLHPVDSPPPYPAEKARGGEIILRTPAQRAIFIAGLVGLVVLVVALQLIA